MNASASAKPKLRVFLFEPDDNVRRFLTRHIDAESDLIVCGEAVNLDEAVARMSEARPDVTIVNVDPLESSVVADLNRLRWSRPSVPLIAVSMRDKSVHGRRLLQAGAAGYVTKSEAALHIIPVIRRVLKGEVYGLDSTKKKK